MSELSLANGVFRIEDLSQNNHSHSVYEKTKISDQSKILGKIFDEILFREWCI
jgi:hypothetical protein